MTTPAAAEGGGPPRVAPEPFDADARALLVAAGLPTAVLDTAGLLTVTAREGARLVGTAAVERCGRWGLLRSVAVAPDRRGAGLGGRLVDAAEALARDDGQVAIALLTTTAAPFFVARGYRPVDREDVPERVRSSAEFTALCPASAVCLIRGLDE